MATTTTTTAKLGFTNKITSMDNSEGTGKNTAQDIPKPTTAKAIGKSTKSPIPRMGLVELIQREERKKMIAISAYHKAERRGFAPGSEMADWLAAEKEINELLNNESS